MSLSDQFGFPFWSALGMLAYGGALTQSDRRKEGIDFIRKGLAAYSATGSGSFVASVLFICLVAEAHANDHDLSEARGAVQEAFTTVEATGATWAEAEVHRVHGHVEQCAPQPDLERAEACFRRSIALARRQDAKLWDLRASTSLACLWRDQGKRSEARDLLAPIYGWFTEGFDTPDLKEAKALLEELP
jgi:predicted ATPase